MYTAASPCFILKRLRYTSDLTVWDNMRTRMGRGDVLAALGTGLGTFPDAVWGVVSVFETLLRGRVPPTRLTEICSDEVTL